MEDALRKVVENIFSNWSALRMAVEHSFAGPGSKMFAVEFVDYMTGYLINTELEIQDIREELEDKMDEDFNTIIEDNSTQEIAEILYKFNKLVKEGNAPQFDVDFKNLVPTKEWILLNSRPIQLNQSQNGEDSSSTDDEDMEGDEDPGWTTVASRRKR